MLPNTLKIIIFADVNELKIKMARPIKETPILHGEDARRFLARMNEGRKETPEQRERRIKDYKLLKSRFVK